MKKPLPYEIAAALLALFGSAFLVGVYMPILNPGMTTIATHRDLPSLSYYLVMTPIPLAILGAAWYFNRKAQKLKPVAIKPAENDLMLKCILFVIVILILLYAFLF